MIRLRVQHLLHKFCRIEGQQFCFLLPQPGINWLHTEVNVVLYIPESNLIRLRFLYSCLKMFEVDKPAGGRSTSAEVLIWGLKYKALAKIDLRLLDVRYPFQGLNELPGRVIFPSIHELSAACQQQYTKPLSE